MEWIIIGLVTLSGALFAIGGTGFKWARRFVMPVVLGIGAYLLGIHLVSCIISTLLTIGAMHFPYGSNSPVWQRALTAFSFAVCLAPLAFVFSPFGIGIDVLFTLITPIVFGFLYWVSLKWSFLTWKLVELATGFAMGGVVVMIGLN
jgi:hypothetical protein